MRRASNRFKEILNRAAEACPEYDLTVGEACEDCKENKHFRPVVYLKVHQPYETMYDKSGLIRHCLVGSGVMSEDVYYHLFFRTGLFPSQRVIDDYIENDRTYTVEGQ